MLGHLIDGVQAESVRIPFADGSVHRLPAEVPDEAALMLADILPTSYEVGALNGGVRPGDTVVSSARARSAWPRSCPPACTARCGRSSSTPSRAGAPRRRSSGPTWSCLRTTTSPAIVRELTGGLGADVAIEAVGLPATFDMAVALVRPGGRVANVGVHGKPTTLHLEELWIKDVTITTGLVDTNSTPMLLEMLAAGRLDAGRIVTHRFGFDEVPRAYDVFDDPVASGALKVAVLRS